MNPHLKPALAGIAACLLFGTSGFTQPALAQEARSTQSAAVKTKAKRTVTLQQSVGETPIEPDPNAPNSGYRIGQHAYRFSGAIGKRAVSVNYLLYLPESYGKDPYAKYPVIVFMHGSREVGKDVNRVRNAVMPLELETNTDFPAIVISPQSPVFGWDSSVPALTELLDDVESRLSIDADRVYLTGLSMGAYGAWVLALKNQTRFAAIVSVVGGYFYSARALCPLADVPVWVFAGKKDRNVNPKESIAVVNALKACGGEPKFTFYEDANHDQSWQRAYAEPDLLKWLLEQRRPGTVG